MHKLNLDEIHTASLENLKKIISICDELKITYFLCYGSLIGAIRHHGFIPWDDDLDIVMLRPDFDQFIEYCLNNEQKIKPYKLLCRKNTPKYPYNIPRFNDMRYKAVYGNISSYESGIFVDIYPLDGADHISEKQVKKLNKQKTVLSKFVSLANDTHFVQSSSGSWLGNERKKILRKYAKYKGKDYFLDKLEKNKDLYSLSESKYICEMVWDPYIVLYEKQWFQSNILVPFEDIKASIPVGYDELLRAEYGNYMKMPPIDERKPSHDYIVFKKDQL